MAPRRQAAAGNGANDDMGRTGCWPGVIALVVITGCVGTGRPQPPVDADLAIGVVDRDPTTAGVGHGPEGGCWQSDIRPAVIETVTEQVLVTPERRDAEGMITQPAVYASESHQRIVSERGPIWFPAPCPQVMTAEFIASLQRALKARGLYPHAVTGDMDADTRAALRRYQRARGLDSDRLSLAAARALGLIAIEAGGG